MAKKIKKNETLIEKEESVTIKEEIIVEKPILQEENKIEIKKSVVQEKKLEDLTGVELRYYKRTGKLPK